MVRAFASRARGLGLPGPHHTKGVKMVPVPTLFGTHYKAGCHVVD